MPENSDDAKKWPRYQEPCAAHSPAEQVCDIVEPTSTISAAGSSAAVSQPIASASTPPTAPAPPKRKPGPRKPKTTLAPLPSAASKPKKITTLEKSAMDWSKHVTPDDKDELEAQRRGGGGYLDKVEFLNRVEERKESVLSENSASKRRRL